MDYYFVVIFVTEAFVFCIVPYSMLQTLTGIIEYCGLRSLYGHGCHKPLSGCTFHHSCDVLKVVCKTFDLSRTHVRTHTHVLLLMTAIMVRMSGLD